MPDLKDFRCRVEWFLAGSAMLLLTCLPYRFLEILARISGTAGFFLMPQRRKIALSNLDLVYGNSLSGHEKRKLATRAFGHMALAAAELMCVEKFARDFRKFFVLRGFEHLEKAFARGKGIVIAISHVGSWEFLSFLSRYILPHRGFVIVKKIRNPYLDREINRLREITGVTVLPKDTSSRTLIESLKKNNIVAVLIDQWAGPEGAWTAFFGKPTSTTTIPARLRYKLGCAVIPCACVRTGKARYEIQIQEPVEFPGEKTAGFNSGDRFLRKTTSEIAVTEELNRRLEEQIRKYPDQWTWGHNRWKEKPGLLRRD
jgi:KDO2-lipid IV(A) lauroyltransferase